MTITLTYPSGHTRTFRNMTQREINRLINTVSYQQELTPIAFVRIEVKE